MKFNKSARKPRIDPLRCHPAYIAGVADRTRIEARGISSRLLLPPKSQEKKWKIAAAWFKYLTGWESARKIGPYPNNGIVPVPKEPLTNCPITLSDWDTEITTKYTTAEYALNGYALTP